MARETTDKWDDNEAIILLSDDDDFPVQTSTQLPVRRATPPRQRPVIHERDANGSGDVIEIISSPVVPVSPVRTRAPPKPKKDTTLLDKLIQISDTDEDDSVGASLPHAKQKTPVRRKALSPVVSSPIMLDSPEKRVAPTGWPPHLHSSDAPDFTPTAKPAVTATTQVSPPRYLPSKETTLAKMTSDDLKNMMRKLDSSRDSIIYTPDKAPPRSPLFVANSSFATSTHKEHAKRPKSCSNLFVHSSDSDNDHAPPEVRAPKHIESIDDRSGDDFDDDIEVYEHNIILSNSPLKRGVYDVDEVINQSSSIGEIRPSTTRSKPRISMEKLKKPSAPIYSFDKSKEQSTASNPFLDKLLSKNTNERLSHEELLKRREAEKSAKQRERQLANQMRSSQRGSSPWKHTSKTPKGPTPKGRSSSHAATPDKQINWADYTFSDDDGDLQVPKFNSAPTERSRVPPERPHPVADSNVEKRTAKRSGTESQVTNSKEARALAKANREKTKWDQKKVKEANKVNRSKEELLGEMIMDAPKSFMDLVRKKESEAEFEGIQIKESPKLDSYVHWQRKVTSTYDSDTDSFVPADLHVLDEDKCCFIFNASDLVMMMEMETPLNTFVKFKRENKKFKNIIIVIMEYEQLLAKLKSKENRKYADKVRAQMGDEVETTSKRRKKNTEPDLSLQEMEETIAELQVNGFKVFPTKNVHETSVWLKSFTYAIAQARYDKLERNPEFSNIGTIRSGKGPEDTYAQILLQLKFMTEPRVKRVTDVVPSFRDLFDHVQRGRLPSGRDGKTIMNSNVQSVVMRLLKTRDDNELIHED